MDHFKPDDFEKMLKVQRAVSALMDRIRREDPGIETALYCFALVRVCRELSGMYPEGSRKGLEALLAAFLERQPVEEESAHGPFLIN